MTRALGQRNGLWPVSATDAASATQNHWVPRGDAERGQARNWYRDA